jgi:hypothetical protein
MPAFEDKTMPRPRHEEFILDVRRSARMLQSPNVQSDSDAVDTDAIAKILHRAARWLTPKVVEHYDPHDFANEQTDQQKRLHLAVEDFRELAEQVPPDRPATVDQFMEGAERLRELIKVVGSIVLAEWVCAIDAVETNAEQWAAAVEWRTRRVNKKMNESLIGPYEAPQLLIFAEPNLYVLDPVARFVPGAQGAFDFALQPSYYTASMYRDDDGVWYVHLAAGNGVANGERVKWSKDSFGRCVELLGAFV